MGKPSEKQPKDDPASILRELQDFSDLTGYSVSWICQQAFCGYSKWAEFYERQLKKMAKDREILRRYMAENKHKKNTRSKHKAVQPTEYK